ncbi:uncharacterized protein LOC143302476 isoform X1 [Bombus vancouverensis nearcticus]|uniref:uncharacterized protein LOC143302476 isoform X1 n=2 Tax=Bombus vancouverensis nearcticus TaxID=2705178 RepID=UPI00402BC99C
MPSPTTLSPKWATPTSGLKRNTILVDFIAAYKVDHLINFDGFQNSPLDLNTCPQRPQSAISDKSLITINFLESMVDQYQQSKREREDQGKVQYFQGSGVSETQYKESGTLSMSCHETVNDTWNRTNSVQEELEVLDEEESDHPETTSDTYLAVDKRLMKRIGDDHAPLEAYKTIATEDSDGSTRCNVTLIERGSKSTNKITQFVHIIGGSSVSQSALKLRVVLDESITSTTRVLFNGTSWIEALPDTSWDEMSYDTSRTKVIHDNSWIVNINWKCLRKNEDDDDPNYEVDNMLSTQQSLGLAINFPWQLRTATTHAETSILDRDAKSSHSRSEPNQTEGKMSPILSLADNWTTPVQPPSIIKKARYEWVSGESPVPQSTIDLLHVFIAQPHTDFTCLCEIGEMHNDTS